MADNVTFQDDTLATPPDATVVATDEVGGAHHQKVKVEFGADGTATPVDGSNPLPVTGTVTTGGLTDAQLRATPVAVSGPLTDAQLRAAAVPVSGTVAATGPLTDTQLRASAVPVSVASVPLPSGAATAANQTTEIAGLVSIDGHVDGVETLLAGGLPTALVADRLKVDGSGVTQPVSGPLTDVQLRAVAVPVSLASAPIATGAATEAKQDDEITKLAGGLPAALGAGGGVKIDGSGTVLPVSAASLPLPSGAATLAEQQSQTTKLAGGLPAALAAGGGVKVEGVAGGVVIPVSAASLPLPSGASTATLQGGGLPSALASDRLKVDGSGVTQPVSAAALPLPSGAATAALQTQPGVDIGDVTVNNASGGAAVNVQDGGNSLTVDSSIKTVYGTEAQAVTCTLTSLASSATAGREGVVVSNLTDLFLDVMVFAQIALTTGTPGNDKRVYIWAYGTVDSATPLYPDTITGADAAITFNSPINLRLLGIIEAPAQSTTYKAGPWSLAQLFGSVPEKWGIAVQNYTGIALTATAGNHKVLYQGVTGKLV